MILLLPTPPSVNALFFNRTRDSAGPGRGKTSAYRSWLKSAGKIAMVQRPKPVLGAVEIDYPIATGTRLDLGNTEKALTDFLVKHGIIEGDSYKIVKRITIAFGDVPSLHGLAMGVKVDVVSQTAAGAAG